jgi:hypothetical protein
MEIRGELMEYAMRINGAEDVNVPLAGRSQTGLQSDRRDDVAFSESLIARANRLYIIGELAPAARLLMTSTVIRYARGACR